MDIKREDELNDLFRHARQAVPAYGTAQQFESVMRRRDETQVQKEVSYRQLRIFAVAACVVLFANITVWALSRRNSSHEQAQPPGGLQSYNLNIY